MPLRNGSATVSSIGSAQIADGSIVNADINASAAIALSKLATTPLSVLNSGSGAVASSDFTSASASYVDVTGCAVTITTGATAFLNVASAGGGIYTATSGGGTVFLAYKVDSGADVQFNVISAPISSTISAGGVLVTGLTPGSHTFQLRMKDNQGTKTWTFSVGTALQAIAIS